jgi:hypothetical protein
MPQIIPLLAVPSQTLSITLNQQNVGISLYTLNDAGNILGEPVAITADSTLVSADNTTITADVTMTSALVSLAPTEQLYIDVTLDGTPVITARLVSCSQPLILTSAYLGFEGELEFFDSQNTGAQNTTNPTYEGLGTQYQLVYFLPSEVAPAP